MKIQNTTATYRLTEETIDTIAEQIEEFLFSVNMERTNIFRIRLSLEEAMLRWMDHFGTGAEVRFSTGVRWRRPEITIAVRGDNYNPLIQSENDLGAWSNSLLSSIGITPRYTWNLGFNIVQVRMAHIRLNPALVLLLSMFIGVAGGAFLQLLLSEEHLRILLLLLNPVVNMFYRLLNAAAGPIIFLTVAAAFLSVRTMMGMRQNGFRLLKRFLSISTVTTVVSLLLLWPFFPMENFRAAIRIDTISDLMEMVFGIVPNDILTPFINGDSPALIFLAVVIGYALLMAGNGADQLIKLIDQADSAGLLLADWISTFSPWFIIVLLIAGITNHSAEAILAVWKPLLAFVILCIIMLGTELIVVGGVTGTSPVKLVRKIWPSFRIAFLTGSVNEAYGANQTCCQNLLGIPRKLTDFGLPIGLVAFMPAGTAAILVYTLHAASYYQVAVSVEWYVRAVFLAVMLQAAGPPLPGVDLLGYAAIFNTLGIPDAALTGVVVADVLFGFIIAAMDQAMLQLELVLEAKRSNQLNESVLKR